MMRLAWRDAAATGLTAVVVALYAAFLADAGLPLVSGPRVLAGVALVAGLAACGVGGGGAGADGPPRWVAYTGGTVGGIAFLAAVLTLITGSGLALGVLVGATVALWAFATVRHAFAGPGSVRAEDRAAHRLDPAGHRS